jgi:hypothetical protein
VQFHRNALLLPEWLSYEPIVKRNSASPHKATVVLLQVSTVTQVNTGSTFALRCSTLDSCLGGHPPLGKRTLVFSRAFAGKLVRFNEKCFQKSREFVPGRDMKPVHLNDSSTNSLDFWKHLRRNRTSFPASALKDPERQSRGKGNTGRPAPFTPDPQLQSF